MDEPVLGAEGGAGCGGGGGWWGISCFQLGLFECQFQISVCQQPPQLPKNRLKTDKTRKCCSSTEMFCTNMTSQIFIGCTQSQSLPSSDPELHHSHCTALRSLAVGFEIAFVK